jgi:hypothetical protein
MKLLAILAAWRRDQQCAGLDRSNGVSRRPRSRSQTSRAFRRRLELAEMLSAVTNHAVTDTSLTMKVLRITEVTSRSPATPAPAWQRPSAGNCGSAIV